MSEPDPGRTEAERIDNLEAKVDSHDGKLDEILAIIKGGQRDRDDDDGTPAGRPASVTEQIAAEFARRDAQKKQADRDADHESLKATVQQLAEKPPAPPQPRRERLLWGKR